VVSATSPLEAARARLLDSRSQLDPRANCLILTLTKPMRVTRDMPAI
jgi:hypothetical protein